MVEDECRRWRAQLVRRCEGYLHSAADAEDAAQEALLRFVRAAGSMEAWPDERKKAWLWHTAANVCRDMLRRRAAARRALEALGAPCAQPMQPGALWRAVGRLPEPYRTVTLLYYRGGYSSQDIARRLRRPAATVRTQLARARKKLRALLEEELL